MLGCVQPHVLRLHVFFRSYHVNGDRILSEFYKMMIYYAN